MVSDKVFYFNKENHIVQYFSYACTLYRDSRELKVVGAGIEIRTDRKYSIQFKFISVPKGKLSCSNIEA